MEVILTRGLPASGKSTWARQYARDHGFARWNNDEFSYMVTGITGPKSFQPMDRRLLGRMREAFIRTALSRGQSIIVDNTNLNPNAFEEAKEIAREYGVLVSVMDFPVSAATCIERDRARGEMAVGEKVILSMVDKFGDLYPWMKEQ